MPITHIESYYKDTNMIIRLAKEFDQHIRFSAPIAARFSLIAIRDSVDELLANKTLFKSINGVGEDQCRIPEPPKPPPGRIIKEGSQPPKPPEREREIVIIDTSEPQGKL